MKWAIISIVSFNSCSDNDSQRCDGVMDTAVIIAGDAEAVRKK